MKKPIAVVLTDTHMSEDNLETNNSIYNQTIEFCVDNGLKYIFHLGDTFHSRKSQPQSILMAYERLLDKVHSAGLKVYSLIGNHDKTDYNSSDSFLSSFKHHPALHLVQTAQLIKFDEVNIAFASFFNDAIYKQHLDNIVKSANENPQEEWMLLTHIGVSGARMNNGVAIESEVKVKQFERFKTVKIGHYHDKQSFANIEYIGASFQHDFGEGTVKGLQVLFSDFSTELIELDFPKYLKYEVEVSTLTQKDLDDLRQEKESGCDFIRVVLVGEEREVKAYNIQALKQVGVDVQMKIPDIELKELKTRIEPFTAQSLLEQFQLFCVENELDQTQGMFYFNKIAQNV
jgi:exonuclease SbcD